MTKEKSHIAIKTSALFATLLSCILACFILKAFSKWNDLGWIIKFWAIVASIYATVLTVSGWRYEAKGRRAAGFIHVVLMLGIAGLGFCQGLPTLFDKSIRGGNGPDANPVGGIIYLAAFGEALVGTVAMICSVTVMRSLFTGKSES